jgi:hypothetical protein
MLSLTRILLLAGILVMFGGTAGVAAPCPTTPLADPYLGGQNFSCEIGQFTIKNFRFESSSESVPASRILVTPIDTPSGVGFQFTAVFDEGPERSSSYSISYEVDPPPDIIHGQQIDLDPTGDVKLVTSLCSVSFPCSGGTDLGTLVATPGNPIASTTFNPDRNFVAVQNSLFVNGPATSNGFSSISILTGPATGGGPAADPSHLVAYASNLQFADSYVNITNTGVVNGFDPAGGICANVYAFDPSEEMVACCACYVTPDGLRSVSAMQDLVSNTLTPGVPGSIVIKLIASTPIGTSCDPATPTAATLKPGLRAWAATPHQNTASGTFQMTENVFQGSVLSDTELAKLTSYCGFIRANGSGLGICKSCRLGGLGGAQQ